MAGNVIKATLIADDRQFKSGFKSAEKSTESFESKIGKTASLAKGLLAGAAATAVIAFANDAKRAFSELEQSVGSVESVFGQSAGKITQAAKGAADEFGLSADEFNTSAALIGSQLKNTLGLSADEAAGKVEGLIGKASDMAATFGGTTSDAISAISALMRGERDSVEKYGVSMNDAAIQARALELGLADSTGELDAQAKATAALDILNEQTADSTGQFAREADTLAGAEARANAEIENNKALVGQALQGAYKDIGIPLMSTFHEVLGNVAVAWMELTGEMTEAEAALARLDLEAGAGGLESLRAALEKTNDEWGRAGQAPEKFHEVLLGMMGGLEATAEDYQWFIDNLPTYAAAMELTTEEETAARQAAEVRLETLEQEAADLERGRGREEEYAAALRGTKGAQDDVTESTDEATAAMREQFDLIDGRLDAFGNYTGAVEDQAAAQEAVNEAIKDFGEGSPEHLAALEDKANANRDVRDAELELIEAGGMTRNEFVKQQSALGLTIDEANTLADKYDALFTPRSVNHTITYYEDYRGKRERQRGGPVRGGTPYLVGERGPEVVVPATNGRVIPNSDLRTGAGMGSGGPTIINNITMHLHAGLGTDPNALAKAVYEALQRYQRMNGPLSLDVRMN